MGVRTQVSCEDTLKLRGRKNLSVAWTHSNLCVLCTKETKKCDERAGRTVAGVSLSNTRRQASDAHSKTKRACDMVLGFGLAKISYPDN